MNPHRHAVLTGDVIASSRLGSDERRHLPGRLKAAAAEVRKALPSAGASGLDVFRGDAWQMVVSDTSQSLRAGIYFRAAIIAASPPRLRIDTRLSIAIGDVDFVPKDQISEGDGQAFRDSGKALDALVDPFRMNLMAPGLKEPAGAVIGLIDALIQQWTARQAQAVKGRLQGRIQTEIANAWPGKISQQAVARHLARAHWLAIERALVEVENSLKTL